MCRVIYTQIIFSTEVVLCRRGNMVKRSKSSKQKLGVSSDKEILFNYKLHHKQNLRSLNQKDLKTITIAKPNGSLFSLPGPRFRSKIHTHAAKRRNYSSFLARGVKQRGRGGERESSMWIDRSAPRPP